MNTLTEKNCRNSYKIAKRNVPELITFFLLTEQTNYKGREVKMAIKKKYINKKHIRYRDDKIYALYYYSNNTVYYNRNFKNKTKMIILK